MSTIGSPTTFQAVRRFCSRVWQNLVKLLGTTTLAIVISFFIPAATFILTIVYEAYQQRRGRSVISLVSASVFNWQMGIAVGVVIFAWVLLFLWSAAKTLKTCKDFACVAVGGRP
jgi:uncharacterized membrane protein YqgA involved in biofilm formation